MKERNPTPRFPRGAAGAEERAMGRKRHTAVSPRWELHGKNLTQKLYNLEVKSRESKMRLA
jgi:hypothetical protein